MSARSWPSDALDMVTALWADGRSGTEISREIWDRLGLYYSRNAVIGKVHRLGLPARAMKRPSKAAARKNSRQRAVVLPRRPKPPPRLTKPAPPRRRPEPPEAPMSKNLTLMDLTSGTCKWPVNDPPRGEPFLFCGAEKPSAQPYCPFHARLAAGPGTESERRAYRPHRDMARECVR